MVAPLLLARAAPSGLDTPAEHTPRQSKTAQVMLFLLDRAVGRENAVSGKLVRTMTRMKPDDVHRVLSSQAGAGRISKGLMANAGPKAETIGREVLRERVCQYVLIWLVAVSLTK